MGGEVDNILAGLLLAPGAWNCIRVLLRNVAQSGEVCCTAVSTPDDDGKVPEDMSSEMVSRRCGPTFFFPADFDTFDRWTGPRGVPDIG